MTADGLKRQVEAVRARLSVIEQDVPVGGCFCFTNPDEALIELFPSA